MDVRLARIVYVVCACASIGFQYSLASNTGQPNKPIDAVNSSSCVHSSTKENVTLQAGIKAGKFTNHGVVKDMKTCIDECCNQKSCDLAFKLGPVCYTVECKSDESCAITPATSPNTFGRVDISRIYRDDDVISKLPVSKLQKQNVVGKIEEVSKQQNQNEKKVDQLQNHNVADKSDKIQDQNETINSDKVVTVQKQNLTVIEHKIDKVQKQNLTVIEHKIDKPHLPSSVDDVNSSSTKDTCIFRRVAHNQTIMGGLKRREEVKDLGSFTDVGDCAQKCCQRENCKVAVIRDKKCFSVQCRTRGYCDSREDPPIDGNTNMIVYIKSRNGETQDRRERCRRHCGSGICMNDKTCLCDVGMIGDHCDQPIPVCVPRCGAHGICNSTNTCTCHPGWEGQTCGRAINCDPPCTNGVCVNAYIRECECNVGWSGQYCHRNNGDKAVVASTGEQVLFTQAEVEPELAIKIPAERPPSSERSEPVSAFTVAACCAMASLFLGIIAVVSMMRQVVHKRNALTREYLEKAQLIN